MHKKGGKKGGDGGSGHEAPARRRKPPATLLESVHFHAMERADYKPPKNHGGLFHHGPHGVTDEIIKRKMDEFAVDDAREMAFQAKEQMRTLQEVHRRVKDTMGKAKDLDVDEISKSQKDGESEDLKSWVTDSRRHIKGAIFRYNESCEERTQELSEFCNWFEMYENIWPLSLVSSDIQYTQLQGDGDQHMAEIDEMDDEGFRTVQALWPKVEQGAEDLQKIMSVTAEMGQKALKADLKEQLVKLSNEVANKQMRIEDLEKKLRGEQDRAKAKEAESIRERQMFEVKIKRKEEEIAQIQVDAEKAADKHRQEVKDIREQNLREVARLKKQQEDQKAMYEGQLRALEQQMSNIKTAMVALEALVEEWKGRYAELEEEKKVVERELQRQGQELAIVRVQLHQVTDELAAERENPYVKKLELQVDELNSKVKVLEEKIEGLEAEIKARVAEIKELKAKLAKAQQEIDELKAEIERRKVVEAELQAKILDTLKLLEAANKRIESLLADVEKLKEVIKAKEVIIAAKDRQIEDMNAAFEKERAKHEADKQELRKEIKEWERRLDETVAELAAEQEKVKRLRIQLKEAEDRVEEANRRKAQLEEELRVIEGEREREREEARERERALAAEKDAVQAQLEKERAEMNAKLEEERASFETTLAEITARCDELQAFKDEIEGRVFGTVQTQTDDAWFASQGGGGGGAGGTGTGGGGGGGGGGLFGGEAMRRRFEALKERMLDLRVDFEGQFRVFKSDLVSAVERRGEWQAGLEVASSDVASSCDAVEEEVLSKRSQLSEGGHGEVAEAVLGMCRDVKRLVSASASMKSSAFEGDDLFAHPVVDRIPVALYEVERIIEGIDAFFDPMSTPPSSLPNSRPSSAKIKHLRPLLQKATTASDAQLAETANDFSKLNSLKPMGLPEQKGVGRQQEQQRAQTQTQMDSMAPSPLKPLDSPLRRPDGPVVPGVIPSWKDRQNASGPAVGLEFPEESAMASWSYSSKPFRQARGVSLVPFSATSSSSAAAAAQGQEEVMSPAGAPQQGHDGRSDTAMSGADTRLFGSSAATPERGGNNKKPMSARGDYSAWESESPSRSPLPLRLSRRPLTDRPKGPSDWRKFADNAPPEIPNKVGTQWAGQVGGGLSGIPDVGLGGSIADGWAASPSTSPYRERELSPDGVRWLGPDSSSSPSTAQRWAPGSLQDRMNRGMVGHSDLADEMLEEMRRRDRHAGSYAPPPPRPNTSGAALGRGVSPDILRGSREGLRPGKVLKGAPGGERSPARGRGRVPHEDGVTYELMHGSR